MTPLNGFDTIASYYDWLAKIVYGRSIRKAQEHFLNRIKPGSRILILGGGTGEILPVLFQLNPTCEVYFIDASKAMIDRARRQKFDGMVNFIHGTEQDVPELIFDCVITNFFLDLFPEQKLQTVVGRIVTTMHTESQWIVTDFVNDSPWHGAMLQVMYWFFNITAKVEATRLPDWREILQKQVSVRQIDASIFYGRFIQTKIYQKII